MLKLACNSQCVHTFDMENKTPDMNQELTDKLNDNYIFAVDRLITGDLNAKSNYISNLSLLDKFFNDYLTYALISLGAAIAVFTANNDLIKTRLAFTLSLILLGAVLILSSVVRAKIHRLIRESSQLILDEYNGKLNAIDLFRLKPDDESKGRLSAVLAQNKFVVKNNWFEAFGSTVIVTMFMSAILLLVLSLIFKIGL